MISTVFKLTDRGKKDTIALIPGWATDYRIFHSLDLPFNYLIPVCLSPDTFENALIASLETYNLNKISILGWSMGGFLAYEFTLRHIDMVDHLILVSIRRKYQKENLREIEEALKTRKKGFLHWFFEECSVAKDEKLKSIKSLLKEYCQEMDLDYLLQTLDYLGKVELEPKLMQGIQKLTIIHGEKDRIAPLDEVKEMMNSVPNSRFINLENAGHLPFLESDFDRYLS